MKRRVIETSSNGNDEKEKCYSNFWKRRVMETLSNCLGPESPSNRNVE